MNVNRTQTEIAKEIAIDAHAGQFRKDGVTPYIKHPEAVADKVSSMYSNYSPTYIKDMAVAVAWLHDVLKDTYISEDQMIDKGIDPMVVRTVKLLTRIDGLDYKEYLKNVKNDDVARDVKIADMMHNLNDDPSPRQINKYTNGLYILTDDADVYNHIDIDLDKPNIFHHYCGKFRRKYDFMIQEQTFPLYDLYLEWLPGPSLTFDVKQAEHDILSNFRKTKLIDNNIEKQ